MNAVMDRAPGATGRDLVAPVHARRPSAPEGDEVTDRCWALLDGLERGLRAHRHWLDTREGER